jgi:hypothetical protein
MRQGLKGKPPALNAAKLHAQINLLTHFPINAPAPNRILVPTHNRAPRGVVRTREDEQRQRIGGGYEAVKFGFLLFL